MGDKAYHVHHSSYIDHSKINVEPLRHGFMNVHLGFLKRYKRYHVDFLVPWNGCWHRQDDYSPPAVPFGEPNPYCRVMEFVRHKDYLLRLRVELYINDENVLKEKLMISCCNTGAPLTLFMRGRIVGENDVPPLLRRGVRQIEDVSAIGEISSSN